MALLPIGWQLGAVYGVVALAASCQQFFDPARLALIGDVVAEPERPRASGLEQVTFAFAIVAGPTLAAPLSFGLGVQWALLANALSFALSFVAVLRMHIPVPTAAPVEGRKHALREFADGLRLFARGRALMALLVAGVLVMLGSGALNALNIF